MFVRKMTRILLIVAAMAVAIGTVAACGGSAPVPKRGVVEGNVGSWNFRRYQKLLDIEVWVPNNKAVAYTASYVRDAAERRGQLEDNDVVNAFVTRYANTVGVLRAVVKFARRLAKQGGYTVGDTKVAGHVVLVVKGQGEVWALWAANRYVVKVGGRGRKVVPGGLIEAYAQRYPSDLRAGALEGPLPPGTDSPARKDPDDEYDPENPTPDWDQYKSKESPK